jgi:hypothetical protein
VAPDTLGEIFDAAAPTTEKAFDTETDVRSARRPHRRTGGKASWEAICCTITPGATAMTPSA